MVKVNWGIFVFIPTYIHPGLHFPYIKKNIPLTRADVGPITASVFYSLSIFESQNVTENAPG